MDIVASWLQLPLASAIAAYIASASTCRCAWRRGCVHLAVMLALTDVLFAVAAGSRQLRWTAGLDE